MIVVANIAIASKNADLVGVSFTVRKIIWQLCGFLMVFHSCRIIARNVKANRAAGIVRGVVQSRDLLTPMWVRLLSGEAVMSTREVQEGKSMYFNRSFDTI